MKYALITVVGIAALLQGAPAAAQSIEEASWNELEERGLAGSANPAMRMSRVELVRAIVSDVYAGDRDKNCFRNITAPSWNTYTHLFRDVPITASYSEDLCIGMFVGVVDTDRNGNFRPHERITTAEAAKIITKAYGIAPFLGLYPKSEVPWYEPYRYALARRSALPLSASQMNHELTWSEFAQILYDIRSERPERGARYGASPTQSPATVPTPTVNATAPTASIRVYGRPRTAARPLSRRHLRSRPVIVKSGNQENG